MSSKIAAINLWRIFSLDEVGLYGYMNITTVDRETFCELCGEFFPHPVTYHMRQSHNGCGQHAEGRGYNSSGNYCLGWAGNCGEGGLRKIVRICSSDVC